MRRHGNVAKKLHWDLCKKNRLENTEKLYEHAPEGAVENEEVNVLWDINVQCDKAIEARRPDIILIDKKEQKGIIIDIAVPADLRVGKKERKKVEKHQCLKRDWKIVETKNDRSCACSDGWIAKLRITNKVGVMQKTALLGTARILRKVLEM